MDDWQRRQYEQQYEQQRERQQREREDGLLRQQEEERQRQEARQREEEQRHREVEADRCYWHNEDGLHQRTQALKGFNTLWKRLGLGSKTGPAHGRRR
ncbi:hypothetical protein BN873_p70014 [Candidatus Competibacter denitrificans Run_A_D11]|uniref:Uncharacterized protein n=1 Tax=Candidatus Competibacter denitrificans Run_A_D11 TaxID=1400863 RepID=W6M9U3_9GAMM|nr:hypothetical protein [Candidatus Competibacter denitrificans]CDI04776.1 hypothetical protein BN873_p70014 [Candidatus Competibacter denitrificans Run_A_D11]